MKYKKQYIDNKECKEYEIIRVVKDNAIFDSKEIDEILSKIWK